MTGAVELLRIAIHAADTAGGIVLAHYARRTGFETKGDGSPVTAADRAADTSIRAILETETSIPVVSEETSASHTFPAGGMFWLVDPLDGTKEFLRGSGEFTVNVALVRDRAPLLGVVAAPAHERLYFACEGEGAFLRLSGLEPRRLRVAGLAGRVRVAVSRDHVGPREASLIEALAATPAVPAGSSLKFCLVAEGGADLYPRFGRTMEWDTAAGQCVLEQAGGGVVAESGARLEYGKPGLENPAFLAWGCPDARDAALAAGSR